MTYLSYFSIYILNIKKMSFFVSLYLSLSLIKCELTITIKGDFKVTHLRKETQIRWCSMIGCVLCSFLHTHGGGMCVIFSLIKNEKLASLLNDDSFIVTAA